MQYIASAYGIFAKLKVLTLICRGLRRLVVTEADAVVARGSDAVHVPV